MVRSRAVRTEETEGEHFGVGRLLSPHELAVRATCFDGRRSWTELAGRYYYFGDYADHSKETQEDGRCYNEK